MWLLMRALQNIKSYPFQGVLKGFTDVPRWSHKAKRRNAEYIFYGFFYIHLFESLNIDQNESWIVLKSCFIPRLTDSLRKIMAWIVYLNAEFQSGKTKVIWIEIHIQKNYNIWGCLTINFLIWKHERFKNKPNKVI